MVVEQNLNKAAMNLKKVIPMMVAHNIAPNPINYSICYEYVAGYQPILNIKIDETLNTYGTIPLLIAEELFNEFLVSNLQENMEAYEEELRCVINNLQEDTTATVKESEAYEAFLEESLKQFDNVDDPATLDVKTLLSNLHDHTKLINHEAKGFVDSLNRAQAEIDRLKTELRQAKESATTDQLTGLENRRGFDLKIQELIAKNKAFSLVILDIDHFKHFNDTYGHLMGDRVLQYIGKTLTEFAKDRPLCIYRFGGEEFVMLIESKLKTAELYAETLRKTIQSVRLSNKKTGEKVEQITASFGVHVYQNEALPDEVIEKADNALYDAKKAGRNRVVVFNSSDAA